MPFYHCSDEVWMLKFIINKFYLTEHQIYLPDEFTYSHDPFMRADHKFNTY